MDEQELRELGLDDNDIQTLMSVYAPPEAAVPQQGPDRRAWNEYPPGEVPEDRAWKRMMAGRYVYGRTQTG